ncbi:MAG: hypothetical protein JXX28_05535 [Deltaproteobacteria bacterium]|nr:hypothetical protein [Deltaproteobacteria bacterium]
MPDLVTHLCAALLPAGLLRRIPVAEFAVGAVLPDVASRVPSIALELLRRGGVPIHEGISHPISVIHTPLGAGALAILTAELLAPELRARGRRWILAGVAVHFALDLAQDHDGNGYYVLFPLSTWDWEAALISSEATVSLAPWLAGITALVWGWRWWRRRPSEPPTADGPPPSA